LSYIILKRLDLDKISMKLDSLKSAEVFRLKKGRIDSNLALGLMEWDDHLQRELSPRLVPNHPGLYYLRSFGVYLDQKWENGELIMNAIVPEGNKKEETRMLKGILYRRLIIKYKLLNQNQYNLYKKCAAS